MKQGFLAEFIPSTTLRTSPEPKEEILRGVYPERGRKRFFASLRMTSRGLRTTK